MVFLFFLTERVENLRRIYRLNSSTGSTILGRGMSVQQTTVEQCIENGGDDLKRLLEKCGNRCHVFNNMSDDITRVEELAEKKIKELTEETHEMLVKQDSKRDSRELPPEMSGETTATDEAGDPSTGGTDADTGGSN
ncbi:hypothetical protein MATL_G00256780 [Megalops atlanticus]|uniref:Uncharacterized protein n=1 Tax=Megalops atlanticus TaxID=7932 RepID=A0A9D3PAE3_MEGAT|nr:hypothetical protein MATL_G00256780 [Megalops atlanticus]